MAVHADDPVTLASVQYDDFVGSAAADGHGSVVLHELEDMVGLDSDRYSIVGFEFSHLHLSGHDGLILFAVDRTQLGGLSVHEFANRNGEVPVVDFKVHDMAALDVLARGLKRLHVQLRASDFDGVLLHRTLRDDLHYSGD